LSAQRNILLRIAYQGTGYLGYQSQTEGATIADVLRKASTQVLNHDVTLRASSRTDAGVHALDLPVGLQTEKTVPLRGLVLGMNAHLPDSVRVISASDTREPFNPRYISKGKVYRYLVQNKHISSPLLTDKAWLVQSKLDLPSIQPALDSILGEHDFETFRARYCQAKHAIRKISHASVRQHPNHPRMIQFDFAGNAFVRHQIRIMVGTLIEMARGHLNPLDMDSILAARERTAAGQTAPSHGLYLVRVRLEGIETLDRWPLERQDPCELFPLLAPWG
jgi:tRNA pseudouridine38-40 synthase